MKYNVNKNYMQATILLSYITLYTYIIFLKKKSKRKLIKIYLWDKYKNENEEAGTAKKNYISHKVLYPSDKFYGKNINTLYLHISIMYDKTRYIIILLVVHCFLLVRKNG
jgi:hypothetical protein